MKRSTIAIILLCILNFTAFGSELIEQKPIYKTKRHAVRIGIGLMPIDHFKSFNFFGVGNVPTGSGSLGEHYFENRFGTATKTFRPVNLMSYTYDLNKWLQIGVFMAYHNADNKMTNKHTGEFYFNQYYHQVSMIPSVRCAWYRSTYMSVYSSIGLGVGVLSKGYIDEQVNDRRIDTVVAGQIVILGMSVGQDLYGFLNLYGGGSIGFTSLGMGYKF